MAQLNPMFHMDPDYMWRWYSTDAHSNLVFMSTQAFFFYEEARQDYDAVHTRFGINRLS